MGEMKIDTKPDVWPVKKWPYKLAHKYKEIVKKEIENMLAAGIIYLIDQSEWASPMVVQPKKHDPTRLRICVDFRELNKVTLTDPFPTPMLMKSWMKLQATNATPSQMDFQDTTKYP